MRPGPLLQIGNTTSRVDFGCDPGLWCDSWSAHSAHHWALGTGHRAKDLSAVAELLGIRGGGGGSGEIAAERTERQWPLGCNSKMTRGDGNGIK